MCVQNNAQNVSMQHALQRIYRKTAFIAMPEVSIRCLRHFSYFTVWHDADRKRQSTHLFRDKQWNLWSARIWRERKKCNKINNQQVHGENKCANFAHFSLVSALDWRRWMSVPQPLQRCINTSKCVALCLECVFLWTNKKEVSSIFPPVHSLLNRIARFFMEDREAATSIMI